MSTCCKTIYPSGSWGTGYTCGRPAKIEACGQHYCGIHNPNKAPTKAQTQAKENRNLQRAKWRVELAAFDLLATQTMGASLNTPDFLEWVADRLVKVYGEPSNIDFVVSLRDRALAGRAAVAKATGAPA